MLLQEVKKVWISNANIRTLSNVIQANFIQVYKCWRKVSKYKQYFRYQISEIRLTIKYGILH